MNFNRNIKNILMSISVIFVNSKNKRFYSLAPNRVFQKEYLKDPAPNKHIFKRSTVYLYMSSPKNLNDIQKPIDINTEQTQE